MEKKLISSGAMMKHKKKNENKKDNRTVVYSLNRMFSSYFIYYFIFECNFALSACVFML